MSNSHIQQLKQLFESVKQLFEMIVLWNANLKKAAANANHAGKRLDDQRHKLIVQVCDEILAGQHPDMFPLHVWVQGAHDALVQLSGTLRTLGVSLYKIGNDIRLMSCGPRAGFAELLIPDPAKMVKPYVAGNVGAWKLR
jgi:fumarate hydratase class II